MKKVSLLLLPALLVAVAATAAERHFVEGIVVRVNERILTTTDMSQRVREREADLGRKLTPAAYPGLVQDAADELCLIERAAELKIDVDDKDVDAALAELKARNNIKDDATLEKQLAALGMTLSQLRSRLRDTITVNRVLSHELGPSNVTEEELRQRYAREKDKLTTPERVHLYHLVLSSNALPEDQATLLERARRFVQAVRSGSDFLKLVNEESVKGDASGGDLGIVPVKDLRSEVRDAAKSLKVGEVSDPFVSPAGVHVIELVEDLPPTVKPFDEVKAQLRDEEESERYRSRIQGIVDGLKKRFIVEVHPELFTAEVPPLGS
jgi:peptidyl-prolyl cis-trans isomerase SurA